MVMASMDDLLQHARTKGYALGYFEVFNLESVRALVYAAEELRSPLVIGFNSGFIDPNNGLEYYASLADAAVKKTTVPSTSFLNEPSSFQQIMQGLRYGFMSIMADFSDLPFKENVKMTRKATEICHSMNVTVEAQIDTIPSAIEGLPPKDISSCLTEPKRAAHFVEETKVDALSISVGNIHGLYKSKAELDFDRIREISKIGVPLVLHGGTGISDESVREAIECGVSKINVGAELRFGFLDGITKSLEEKHSSLPEQIFKLGEENIKKIVKEKMKVYGCAHKI